ncbi:MAG: asparagine synthase (glutamine-hydrolyzing), partial [bacterium]
PMANEDGTVWVVSNGEIYNFRDLRAELQRKGHRFKTQSDTETLVHAWEEWAGNMLDRLRGMFAFVILDLTAHRAFFARDRVGIKPLYYFYDGKSFAFASELTALKKGLIKAGLQPAFTVRPASLVDYLRYGYVPSPDAIYEGINKLPPAFAGVLDFRNPPAPVALPIHRYWTPSWKPEVMPTADWWKKHLYETLLDSVKSHLVSDVPLGAFLSGGTDSSAVVALMTEARDDPVRTFSIGYRERLFNELPYARMVARKFETVHTEQIIPQQDLQAGIEELTRIYDEPFADSSALPTLLVSRLTRQSVAVALSGDGGDELFAGYGRYARILRAAAKAETSSPQAPIEMFDASMRIFTDDQLRTLLHPDFHSSISEVTYLQAVYAALPIEWPLLARLEALDFHTYLPENNLTKVDRASMANSLEVRVPLLDHQVVEFAAKIPPEFKLRASRLRMPVFGGRFIRKWILKKTMEPHLPRRVLYRKKRGFSIPLRVWMTGDFLKCVEGTLHAPDLKPFFDEKAVAVLIEQQRQNPRAHPSRLWALYFFARWLAR